MSDRMNIYIDGAEQYDIMVGGEVFEFVVDRLIRHKWPDDKPVRETDDEYKAYLIRLDDGNAEWYQTSSYFDEGFGYIEKYITHWWELPEVEERE